MKRAILVLAAMAVALGLASGIALAATIVGTDKAETLIGTRYADYIRADGGADEVRGLRGPDELYGNRGRDKIIGGRGEDRLYGGRGDDHIVSRDLNDFGIGQRDMVDCGPGHDTYATDFDDGAIRNCEEGTVSGS